MVIALAEFNAKERNRIMNNVFLNSKTAVKLYENVKNLPILDYHCHLSPREIADDIPFENITDMLLCGDHYKWRAMRLAGISEELITGSADKLSKFKAWIKTFERLIGSPLYSWFIMEMEIYFNITEVISSSNAESIYNRCNSLIKSTNMSPKKIIRQSNVELICTTDDPDDDLSFHKAISEDKEFKAKVLPTFRPDRLLKNDAKLSKVELLSHLERRLDFFCEYGCKLSDHSLENFDFDFDTFSELARMYADRNITMQLHIGALRSINSNMKEQLGVDAGFDIMNDFSVAEPLSKLFDSINNKKLPKTIVYSLNSKDNITLTAIAGSFKNVYAGAAWWFNDNKNGIIEHLKYLANNGQLAYFLGMLTDSRSFLSYTRHDYFRRILCDFVAELIDKKEFLGDELLQNQIIADICYNNIRGLIL